MISAGSMKVVFPLEDSSYTKPCSLRLEDEFTGIRYFPSLTPTDAPSSAMPASWACLSMAAALFEITLSLLRRLLRIEAS